MSEHSHRTLVEGCFRCDLNRDEMKDIMETRTVLEEAQVLINGDRRQDYGGPLESFQRIADLWTPVLGIKVTPEMVCMCLVQLKVARAMNDIDKGRPIKRDSIVDMAGYTGLFEKIEADRQAGMAAEKPLMKAIRKPENVTKKYHGEHNK